VNYYLETPGMEEGWDRLNIDRSLQLAQGNLKLKPLPAESPAATAKKPVVKKPAPRTKPTSVAKKAAVEKVAANKVAAKKPAVKAKRGR
jgi:hypothetical protein